MQINNSTHYSSDPYLLSKSLHKNEEKSELQLEQIDDSTVDISSSRIEEKLYAKSVNAAPATTESTTASDGEAGSRPGFNSAPQQAVAAYAEVESSLSSQQFNQLQEIV